MNTRLDNTGAAAVKEQAQRLGLSKVRVSGKYYWGFRAEPDEFSERTYVVVRKFSDNESPNNLDDFCEVLCTTTGSEANFEAHYTHKAGECLEFLARTKATY